MFNILNGDGSALGSGTLGAKKNPGLGEGMVLEGYAFWHLDHLAANLAGTSGAITIQIFKIKILVVRHIDDENGVDILGDRHPAGGPQGSGYLIRLTVQPGSLKETPEGGNGQSDT